MMRLPFYLFLHLSYVAKMAATPENVVKFLEDWTKDKACLLALASLHTQSVAACKAIKDSFHDKEKRIFNQLAQCKDEFESCKKKYSAVSTQLEAKKKKKKKCTDKARIQQPHSATDPHSWDKEIAALQEQVAAKAKERKDIVATKARLETEALAHQASKDDHYRRAEEKRVSCCTEISLVAQMESHFKELQSAPQSITLEELAHRDGVCATPAAMLDVVYRGQNLALAKGPVRCCCLSSLLPVLALLRTDKPQVIGQKWPDRFLISPLPVEVRV